jgi:hypothetical protein
MKTKLLLLALILLSPFSFLLSPCTAQVPLGFNYQAIARDGSGAILANTALPVKITIQTSTGTVIYEELFSSVVTNQFGLISLVVGTGVWQSGSAPNFSSIDWKSQPLYLKTTIQYPGVTWTVMGTSQIWGVPYSLLAKDVQGPLSKLGISGTTDNMEDALFEVKNKAGNTVFAVYNEGVRAYVGNGDAKGVKGGFSIGGYDATKGIHDLLWVTSDSVRVYVDNNPATKGVRGGFSVGGYDMTKGTLSKFLNIETDPVGTVNPAENRILWYPLKNAFLSGRVLITDPANVGENSFASGYEAKAIGQYSQSLGYECVAQGNSSIAVGYNSISNAPFSTSFGDNNTSNGTSSITVGSGNVTTGNNSLALGLANRAVGPYSVAIGYDSETGTEAYSCAIGYKNKATGAASVALGGWSTASGWLSLAEGYGALAQGSDAVSLGYETKAIGDQTLATGYQTQANGNASIAMGYYSSTGTSARSSVALGYSAFAGGNDAVALGYSTSATGGQSFAMGAGASASQYASAAFGENTISSSTYGFVIGKANEGLSNSLFEIGYGSFNGSSGTRSNILTVLNNGRMGIGTSSPAYPLDVKGRGRFISDGSNTAGHWLTTNGGTDRAFIGMVNDNYVGFYGTGAVGWGICMNVDNGCVGIGVAAPAYRLQLPNSSTASVGEAQAYAWATYSDARVKTDQAVIPYGLSDIMKIHPMIYNHHSSDLNSGKLDLGVGTRTIGMFAQELYDIIPEAVIKPADESKTLWSIDYNRLVPVLIRGIQEQQSRIEEQKQENLMLKEELQSLKEEIGQIKAMINK